jgi:rare lipoprotein A
MISFKHFFIILSISLLVACGGQSIQKPDTQNPSSTKAGVGKGGYYLDDGPGDNAPADIDGIPDATPKTENLLARANRPYSALGEKYTPMTKFTPYVKQGMASWYGKRYHGRKTSSGEVYDMYAMTGAHTTLPIPSYVKVTNPANGRSVIVRINDRGPFKHDRLIDLSYAAAYKLRIIAQGSSLVEVELIDTSNQALQKTNQTLTAQNTAIFAPQSTEPSAFEPTTTLSITNNAKSTDSLTENKNSSDSRYYVQVGAFKNESNGDLLQKKVLSLNLAGNAAVTNVYNNGLYRVKLGPFNTKQEADSTAYKVQQQLNDSTIVTNQ